jgi:ATP-dependent DNA helicase RecQ
MTTPNEILKTYWGYDTFRTPQLEIINSVVEGKDVLAILPTGGGKSVCFQVPALLLDGLCLVITPLIALIKDQVYQLKERNIRAGAVFTGMSFTRQKRH